MSMEMPMPQAAKKSENPLLKRLGDTKANRELRNAFEALGQAGKMQAAFESAMVKLEELDRSKDPEIKEWAKDKLDTLTRYIDSIATERDQSILMSDIDTVKFIIDQVNKKAPSAHKPSGRIYNGETESQRNRLDRMNDENTRLQGGPR